MEHARQQPNKNEDEMWRRKEGKNRVNHILGFRLRINGSLPPTSLIVLDNTVSHFYGHGRAEFDDCSRAHLGSGICKCRRSGGSQFQLPRWFWWWLCGCECRGYGAQWVSQLFPFIIVSFNFFFFPPILFVCWFLCRRSVGTIFVGDKAALENSHQDHGVVCWRHSHENRPSMEFRIEWSAWEPSSGSIPFSSIVIGPDSLLLGLRLDVLFEQNR